MGFSMGLVRIDSSKLSGRVHDVLRVELGRAVFPLRDPITNTSETPVQRFFRASESAKVASGNIHRRLHPTGNYFSEFPTTNRGLTLLPRFRVRPVSHGRAYHWRRSLF